MMEVKLLELRDIGTRIPLLAVELASPEVPEQRLLRHVGYSLDATTPSIMITPLNGERTASADPYHWGDRTFATAHQYIIERWHDLRSGDVVDVEFILGESAAPKASEIQRC